MVLGYLRNPQRSLKSLQKIVKNTSDPYLFRIQGTHNDMPCTNLNSKSHQNNNVNTLASPSFLSRSLSSYFMAPHFIHLGQFAHKSDNLQYNTLDYWVAVTNNSTNHLMFQVLFLFHNFLQNSMQKLFQIIFYLIFDNKDKEF